MSRRITSEFGTLGERVQSRPAAPLQPIAARHVWIREQEAWHAGVLLGWVHNPDGTWAGRVAYAPSGEPEEALLTATLLRPADVTPPG